MFGLHPTVLCLRRGWVAARAARRGHNTRSPRATLFWRTFWVLMFVGHLPLWLELTTGANTGVQCLRWLLLTASQLFFVIKILDLASLRLPRERHVRRIALVLILLLHGDVARRLCGGALDGDVVVPAIVASTAAVLVAALVERARAARPIQRPAPRTLRQRDAHWLRAALAAQFQQPPPLERLVVRCCLPHRGPPA